MSDRRDLAGCRVVVTRERPGRLAELLADAGADVDHVALIEVVDPPDADADAGSALARAMATVDDYDWLVVTSPAGAERVSAVVDSDVRLAAVGSATATTLASVARRPVDLVPDRQLATSLAEAFNRRNPTRQRVLVAQADRAAPTLVELLVAAGHDVDVVTAYSTRLLRPDQGAVARLRVADAVLFASGSAAAAWAEALGDEAAAALPPLVVAIGPSTEEVARQKGLKVSHVSADHSLSGLVRTLAVAWHDATGTAGTSRAGP